MDTAEYRLIRSDRRSMALEVTKTGEVLVRAPYRTGQREIEEFVRSHRDWISNAQHKQWERTERHPEPDEATAAAWKKMAEEQLPERVAFYAEKMKLYPTSVRITSARTRFGSCSAENRICFSWRLMEYPPEAVDYVVVHELAHIRHKNHGKAFYELIAQYLPDWQERRNLFRDR